MPHRTVQDVLDKMNSDPTQGSRDDRINFLIDLNSLMFRKMFVADNGKPAIIEQVHLNSEYRKEKGEEKKFKKNTLLSSLIGGFIAAILSIALFLTFGIN